MSTYRLSHKNDHYTRISNATLQDPRLTLEERGVLTLVLSYPDDWEIRPHHLKEILGVGIKRVRRALTGLINLGYLAVQNIRDHQYFAGNSYSLYESPNLNPNAETYSEKELSRSAKNGIPRIGNPNFGNPNSGNTRMVTTNLVSTNLVTTKTADIQTNKKQTKKEQTNQEQTTHTNPSAQARVCASPSPSENFLSPSGGQKQPIDTGSRTSPDLAPETPGSRVISVLNTNPQKDPLRATQTQGEDKYSAGGVIRACDDARDRSVSWFRSRAQEDQYFQDLRGFLQEFAGCAWGKATAIAKKSQLRLLTGKPEVDDRDYFQKFESGGFQALKDSGMTGQRLNRERLIAKYQKALGVTG